MRRLNSSSPRHTVPRGAFSLIELMVVLVIIGILAGLLLPTLGRARMTAQIARVNADMESIKAGITAFKQRYGVDPPSSITIHEASANWGTDPRSRAIIKQIWPQFDFTINREMNGDSSLDPIPLDGAECLVFFLGGMVDIGSTSNSGGLVGFSKNPRNPFALDSGSRDGPFFEFVGGVDPTSARPVGRLCDTDGDSVVEYMDPLPSQTQPYVYFSSYGGAGYRNGDNSTRIAAPYYQDAAGKNAYNRESFQLISPGPDFAYGLGGYFNTSDDGWASKVPATAAQRLLEESDNITNFHTGTLK